MAKPFKGTINIDIRDSEPDWTPFEPPVAPNGAPNVLRFGGHALYIKNNRLHYVNNFLGSEEQKIAGREDISTGKNLILTASFDKDRQENDCATGILSIYHGDRKVGEARIRTQLGAFAVAGSSLYVGRNPGEPVTEDYPGGAPHSFTGGTINRIAIDVSGEPYQDLEREAALMLMRE